MHLPLLSRVLFVPASTTCKHHLKTVFLCSHVPTSAIAHGSTLALYKPQYMLSLGFAGQRGSWLLQARWFIEMKRRPEGRTAAARLVVGQQQQHQMWPVSVVRISDHTDFKQFKLVKTRFSQVCRSDSCDNTRPEPSSCLNREASLVTQCTGSFILDNRLSIFYSVNYLSIHISVSLSLSHSHSCCPRSCFIYEQ